MFRTVALVESRYIRNEWLYIGRRNPGSIACSFEILGRDAALFHLNFNATTLTALDVDRLVVRLEFDAIVEAPESIDAHIQISCHDMDALSVPLYIDWEHLPPTSSPSSLPSSSPSSLPSSIPSSTPSEQPPLILERTRTTKPVDDLIRASQPKSTGSQKPVLLTAFLCWAFYSALACIQSVL